MFESYEEDYAAAAKKINHYISETGQNEGNFGECFAIRRKALNMT
jgi:hypothetical protein